MNNYDIITMSNQERIRLDVMQRVLRKELSQVKAAQVLGLTDRRVRKLLKDFKAFGVRALVSKRRGFRSNRAKPEAFKQEVLGLFKERYDDFGPTLACEKLLENHNINIHHTTLRNWLIAEGIFKNRRRKSTQIHQSRPRRECFGELVQIDGSHHDWFEGRGEKCCLIVFVDDATNLMYCRFEEAETTLGYFRAAKDYITTYGIPTAFYSDKHSVFRVNQDKVKTHETQFQRACKELDITLICANSPQAKGRIERTNKTLQDRLVKEMRLNNICNIEQANDFLPQFIQNYNKKFLKEPKCNQDMHKPLTLSEDQLEYFLSKRTIRQLSKNLEFSINNKICQLTTSTKGYRLRHANISIIENTNHEYKVFYKGKSYEFSVIDKDLKTTVTDNKNLNVWAIKTKAHKPAPDHPWVKFAISKACKVSQIKRKSLNQNKPDLSKSH